MSEDFFTAVSSGAVETQNADCINALPLAMAYVPIQKWREIYTADVALDRGTLFSQLDKPFLGRRAVDD